MKRRQLCANALSSTSNLSSNEPIKFAKLSLPITPTTPKGKRRKEKREKSEKAKKRKRKKFFSRIQGVRGEAGGCASICILVCTMQHSFSPYTRNHTYMLSEYILSTTYGYSNRFSRFVPHRRRCRHPVPLLAYGYTIPCTITSPA